MVKLLLSHKPIDFHNGPLNCHLFSRDRLGKDPADDETQSKCGNQTIQYLSLRTPTTVRSERVSVVFSTLQGT